MSVPGANLSVQHVEADGQRVDELSCRAEELPLLGGLAVVASIAEQRRALTRCAPKGGAVALTWSFDRGRARRVQVVHASSARVGTCVAGVMEGVAAPFTARCGAVVLVGDAAGADRALTGLRASSGR